jgi:hypothetical protein
MASSLRRMYVEAVSRNAIQALPRHGPGPTDALRQRYADHARQFARHCSGDRLLHLDVSTRLDRIGRFDGVSAFGLAQARKDPNLNTYCTGFMNW